MVLPVNGTDRYAEAAHEADGERGEGSGVSAVVVSEKLSNIVPRLSVFHHLCSSCVGLRV